MLEALALLGLLTTDPLPESLRDDVAALSQPVAPETGLQLPLNRDLTHDGDPEQIGDIPTHGIGGGEPDYGEMPARPRPDAVIHGGEPKILGAMDRSMIDEVIRRHLGTLRECYTDALAQEPKLTGRMSFTFVIHSTGEVIDAKLRSATVDASELGDCLTAQFLRMKFPASDGAGIVIVSYPFWLRSGA